MILSKRIDVLPLNLDVGTKILMDQFSEADRAQVVPNKKSIRTSLYRLLFARKNKNAKELLEKFNIGLFQLRKEGYVDAYIKENMK